MITQDLGIATAYGYAKSKGYTGTEAEFAELMASYASTAQTAIEAADRAVEANTAAQSAKISAQSSASTASTAAQTATSKASEAVAAAGTATTKASEASQSATSASQSAESAGTSAQTATTAATTATTKASEASESAATATTAKTDAETARDAAAQSASEAAASAESIDPDEFNRKIYAAFATDTATGVIASLPDGADSIPMKDVLVHIEPVQEGSGDPSPDNVRPITGWTAAKVTRTGKNLFETKNVGRTHNGVTYALQADGKIALSGTASDTSFLFPTPTANMLTYIPAGTYTLSGAVSLNVRLVAITYEVSGNTINKIADIATDNGAGAEFSLTVASWVGINIRVQSGQTTNVSIGIQIELGSTATDYEPYSGQTYDITFPTEAGTVYGGILDVTSGVLTVDRMGFTFDGTENWKASEMYCYVSGNPMALNNGGSTQVSSHYKTDYSFGGDRLFAQKNGSITKGARNDATVWKAYLAEQYSNGTPVEICYKLATPITYQLTPQEITSLLGENNVWADTGNSDVEYRADTKLYITKKITDAVNALS